METIYKPKRVRRSGAVFAVLFTMLLLSAFFTQAQTNVLNLKIECYGIVKVKIPGNTEAYRVIQGPVEISAIDLPGFSSSEIWYMKVIPDPGYEFLDPPNWLGVDGADVLDIGPGDIGYPDPQGYTYKINTNEDKYITAQFTMIPLDPPMTMSADFDIYTIPGTDASAKGTPLIVPIDAFYPVIAPGSYPDVLVDALLSTDRTGGFAGLRILDITPAPGPVVAPIELGSIMGVHGVMGNDILLSDIFDIITFPSDFVPPTLESQSGLTINWEFTVDGIMEGDDDEFTVTVSTIAYQNAAVDYTAHLCETELASTDIDVYVNEVAQTLGPGAAPAPITLNQCDGHFIFNATYDYPAIENIDLAGEIQNNGTVVVDRVVPANTTITWTYLQVSPPGGSTSGTYTVPGGGWAAGSSHYFSDIILASVPPGVAPTPLVGHDDLTIKWTFDILFPTPSPSCCNSSGIYNIDMQPIVQLGGVDYKWGDLLEVKLINTKIYAEVAIGPASINAVSKAPIIVPVTTTFTCAPYSPDHAGINVDGRISLTNYATGARIIGVRANGVNVPLVTPYPTGIALNGPKKFSEIFASGWPKDVTTVTATPVNWEFDIDGVNVAPTSFTMTVELFTFFDAVPPECSVASDAVNIQYSAATFDATPTAQDVCMNDEIEFTVQFNYNPILNIEPVAYDINTDVEILNTNHEIPAGTTISWTYSVGPVSGMYTVGTAIPVGTTTMLSTLVGGAWGTTVPNKLINAVTATWSFTVVIPGDYDPPTDMTGFDNAGLYTLTFKPVAMLKTVEGVPGLPYDNYYYETPTATKTINFTIPLYELVMAADPDYAGTTNPEILPPGQYHEVGCGAYVHVLATPSELGGWAFNGWTSEDECPPPAIPDPDFGDFLDPAQNPTIYTMPDCDAEVTANFLQKEYEFVIGVQGCGQVVKVWDEAQSTVIAVLTGNRACADIEPSSGDELTFTHGETIVLEVIPTLGWAWGEWHYCDPFDDRDPLFTDFDFTYLYATPGHFFYKLVFRSDKELKAVFRKVLLADIVIDDKTYDGTNVAFINTGESSLNGFTVCPSYECSVSFDWTGAEAHYANKHASWDGEEYFDKPVFISGLALNMDDDCFYILGPVTYNTFGPFATGYSIPNEVGMSAAKIFRKEVCVTDLVAGNKVYDGNTSTSISGTFTGFDDDDILPPPPPVATVWGTITNGQFNNKNVGTNKPVTYTVTLFGPDAPNYYVCSPLPTVTANITCRPLVRVNLVAQNREYDGTDDAVITGWGNWQTGVPGQGIVSPDVVGLVTTSYDAHFDNQFVGTGKTVTVTGLSIGSGGAGHTTDYLNYCLVSPSYGTGNIVPPVYAMFTPSYQNGGIARAIVDCNDPDPILDVKVEDPLFVEFSDDVFDFQGLQLPTVDLGEFVKLEVWTGPGDPAYGDESVGGFWVLVDAFSFRSGNEVTVVPGIPTSPGTGIPVNLAWETWYRLRFDDIWYEETFSGVLTSVEYRRDQTGGVWGPNILACELVDSRQIIFKTISSIDSPVVEPSGCDEYPAGQDMNANYNDPIQVHFVNPVKYRNGNLISDILGNPNHKFKLWGRPLGWGGAFVPIIFQADPEDFEWVDGEAGPTRIVIIPQAQSLPFPAPHNYHALGQMLHCFEYYIEWRDVNDLGPGFQDMTDGSQIGPVEWAWCTTCDFNIKMSYTANSSLQFPTLNCGGSSTAIKNNLKFYLSPSTLLKDLNDPLSGSTFYPDNGKVLTYKATQDLTYRFEPIIGQGYHISDWKRWYNGVWYNVYYKSTATPKWQYATSTPGGGGWNLFTGNPSTGQPMYIDWTAAAGVPFDVYQWKVNYDINKYNVLAKASPAQTPTGSGISFTGGIPFSTTITKFDIQHGSTVTVTARPKAGYYNTGWSYNPPPSGTALPPSVQSTVVATNYTYDPCAAPKPQFVDPLDGVLTFNMCGPDPVHNTTYTVQANFDVFYPRIDLEVLPVDPADVSIFPGCNYVTYTAQFVQGEQWGIICAEQNYAAFYYGTPITLTPVACNCWWEFSHYMVWDGTYEDGRSQERHYVPFVPTQWMPITSNLDIKAYFKRATYHITAETFASGFGTNVKGSVLIEGINAEGDFVQLIGPDAQAGDYFTAGTVLMLTVYPEPGWEVIPIAAQDWNNPLVNFLDDYIDRSEWEYIVGGTNPFSVVCGTPYDLVANLRLRQYVIEAYPYFYSTQDARGGTVTGTPAGAGLNKFTNSSVPGTAIGTFEHFFPTPTQTFQLQANPKTYYKFSYWWDEDFGYLGTVNPLPLPIVNGPRSIRAVFVEDLPTYPLTVTHSPADAGYEMVEQNNYYRSAPYNFHKHNIIPGFPSVIEVTAVPYIGWEFVNWTILSGGITLIGGTTVNDETIMFNMPANAVSVRANYQKIDYTLDLVVRMYLRPADPCYCNIVNYGLLLQDITPGSDGIYNFGDVVTLKVSPLAGFTWVNWMTGTLSDWPGCGERVMGEDCILTGWQINPPHGPVQYPGSYTFTYTIPPQWEEEVTLYALGIETAFPQYPLYELTTMADPSDKGVTWGDGNYPATVIAMVDQYETTPGWGFDNWEVNGWDQAAGVSPLGIFMDGDKMAVAEYGLITYTLNTYAVGCGSTTPDGYGFEFNIEDDPIYIQAYEDCCNYDFVGWFYDYSCTVPVTDALGQPVTDLTFYWIPVPMNVDIFGLFVEQPFDVNLSVARDVCGGPAMGGTAEIIAGNSPGYVGEVVTLLATPAAGYLFEAWYNEYCEIVVEEPQFNHTINCWDNTFIAVFNAIPYQVNVSAVPPAGGTATGGGTYYVGDQVTVTANPTVGWAFNGWFDGGVLVSTNLAYTFTMPAGNRTLEARFTITQVTLTVNVVGPGSVQVKNGATVLAPPYTVDYGTVLTLVASPGGLFDEWTGDLTGSTNPTNITMNGNKTVTAHFNTCDPPTNLASTTTAKRATVTWTTPAGQTAELRYKLSTSGTWGAWGAATSPKVITGLTPNKTYNVEVRTVCGPGIYSTTLAGTFTTKKLGDVNCDGVIDVLDVIALTGYILGTIPGNDCLLDGGDINGDGFYNVLDVVALVNIINGGGSKASVMSIPADIYLTPDVIKLNSDGTMSGLQFELKGPNVHHLTLNLILNGFQMEYTVEGHTLTGVIYQLNNEPLPAGMIDLITISGESITEWGEVIGGNYGESEVKVNKHGAITGEYSMMVYPNPTKSEVNTLFTVPADSRVQIRLLDFSGRMITEVTDAVYSTGEHLLQLNQAQSLTPGLYILQMTAIGEETPDLLFTKEVKVVIIK